MRILIGLVSVFIATFANGQAPVPVAPKELAPLRESWTKARQLATAPLDKKYLDALGALKLRYTRDGNLSAALAIDAEMRTLSSVESQESPKIVNKISPPETANSKQQLEKHLIGTKWTIVRASDNAGWGTFEFKDKGIMTFNQERKWTATGKRTANVEGYNCTFSEDLKTFRVVWGGSGELVGTVNP